MLIIFDNDGVLVDSEGLVKQAQAKALFKNGFSSMPYERLLAETVGLKWSTICDIIEAEEGKRPSDAVHHLSRTLYRDAAKAQLSPTPGIEKALIALKKAKIPYAVASTGAPEKIRFSLALAGLLEHFDDAHLFSVTQVARGKPAPDVYLLAATQLGADPADCLVIEDAVAGIQGAKRAGMQVAGFLGGSHAQGKAYRARLKAENPDAMWHDMAELMAFIAR